MSNGRPKPGNVNELLLRHLHVALHVVSLGVGAALYRAVRAGLRPFDDVFHEGREVGYNSGYREGRREGKPVVVPLSCPDCGRTLSRQTG